MLAPSYREHVLLLCNGRNDYDSAAIDVLNEALKAGQLCVYASVLNGSKAHVDKMSSGILEYRRHVENGDLLVVDFKPFSESAQQSDFSLFAGLKAHIEQMIEDRVGRGKSDKVMVFAEAAGELCEHGHFEKSVDLEGWWDGVHADWVKRKLNITIICPHSVPVLLGKEQNVLIAKNNIAHLHTLTLELEKLQKRRDELAADSRPPFSIFIVEPEADLRLVYQHYFERLNGVQAVMAATSKEAMERIRSMDGQGFDVIIIDAHLKDSSAIEIARQIIAAIPDQRIVFTTTSSPAEMISQIRTIRLRSEEILVKPFSMSSLLELMKPPRQQENQISWSRKI